MASFRGLSGIDYRAGSSALSWLTYDGTLDVATASVSTAKNSGALADACVLSSTRGVIVVANSNNSSHGTAYLINLATGAVLHTLVFKADTLTGVRAAKIDTRYFAVVYTVGTTTEGGFIIDTNGDTLATVGSEQALVGLDLTGNAFDIDFLDTNKLICGFVDATDADGYGSVLSTNTATGAITVGTATGVITAVTAASTDFRARATSTTTFVLYGGASGNTLVGAGSVSGTAVTRVTSAAVGSFGAAPQVFSIGANGTFTDFVMSASGDDEESSYLTFNGSAFTHIGQITKSAYNNSGFVDLATVNSERYGLVVEFQSATKINLRGAKLDTTNKAVVFTGYANDIGDPANTGFLQPGHCGIERISDTSALVYFTEDSTNNVKVHIANAA